MGVLPGATPTDQGGRNFCVSRSPFVAQSPALPVFSLVVFFYHPSGPVLSGTHELWGLGPGVYFFSLAFVSPCA